MNYMNSRKINKITSKITLLNVYLLYMRIDFFDFLLILVTSNYVQA